MVMTPGEMTGVQLSGPQQAEALTSGQAGAPVPEPVQSEVSGAEVVVPEPVKVEASGAGVVPEPVEVEVSGAGVQEEPG